jgi:hypothetical protein
LRFLNRCSNDAVAKRRLGGLGMLEIAGGIALFWIAFCVLGFVLNLFSGY